MTKKHSLPLDVITFVMLSIECHRGLHFRVFEMNNDFFPHYDTWLNKVNQLAETIFHFQFLDALDVCNVLQDEFAYYEFPSDVNLHYIKEDAVFI